MNVLSSAFEFWIRYRKNIWFHYSGLTITALFIGLRGFLVSPMLKGLCYKLPLFPIHRIEDEGLISGTVYRVAMHKRNHCFSHTGALGHSFFYG